MTHILMVVTSTNRLGESETPSGAWLEELAAPYNTFRDAGFDITLASPQGGQAPIDPMSLEDPWLTGDGRRFMNDDDARQALAATPALPDLDAGDFDSIFLVGGVATAWDYPVSESLARLTSDLYAAGCPLVGVCHGVLGLVGTVDSEGRHVVNGRRVTGVSNNEEQATGFDKIVPVLPQDRLESLGGRYSSAEPFQEHVILDGQLMTGQNPASAGPLARRLVEKLTGFQ